MSADFLNKHDHYELKTIKVIKLESKNKMPILETINLYDPMEEFKDK